MNLKKINDNFEDEHLVVSEKEFSLADALNSLFAEELQAAYDYFKVYPFLVGTNRSSIAEEFLHHAEEELSHAEKLIIRINELGYSNFIGSLSELHTFTTCDPTPVDTDVYLACVANKEAEQCAIDHYTQVINELGDTDVVTVDLLKEILADEQQHYSDLQEYINDINSVNA